MNFVISNLNWLSKSVVVRLTVYDKDKGIIGTEFAYPHLRTLKPKHKNKFKMTSSIGDFKGMKYYKLSLERKKPDGSKGYVDSAKIYKSKTTDTSDGK